MKNKYYKIGNNTFYCTEISKDGDFYGFGVFNGYWENNRNRFTLAFPSKQKNLLVEITKEEAEKVFHNYIRGLGFIDGEIEISTNGSIKIGGRLIYNDDMWVVTLPPPPVTSRSKSVKYGVTDTIPPVTSDLDTFIEKRQKEMANFKHLPPPPQPYDNQGNAEHYKKTRIETIDMMISIWGKDAVMKHCEMTAFKYRMRIGHKEGQSVEQELKKANWYEAKAKELLKQ
jgi:hypothetical protein